MKLFFNRTDMMVLFCIGTGSRFFNKGISLKELMMRSDSYDRSYFLTEELADSLKKLMAIDFIDVKSNKIYAKDTYRKEKRLVCKEQCLLRRN